jgi:Methyltransferase domain
VGDARARSLAAAGLAEVARVVLAPLEPHPLARDGLKWYAHRALRSLPPSIDLPLVDGPPAFELEIGLSRYPALPALANHLTPDATVLLDDIDRPGNNKPWKRGSATTTSASSSDEPSGSRWGAGADLA